MTERLLLLWDEMSHRIVMFACAMTLVVVGVGWGD